MIDFDLILEKVGSFGTYQLVVFLGMSYFGLPAGMNTFASVFIAYTPDYRCAVYPFDNSTLYPNLTEDMILNMSTPLGEDESPEDSCVRYGYNLSECTPNNEFSCVNKSEETISCDQGYHYDDSLFTETIVTEFDLVCDRRILNSVAGSMYMAGLLVGSLANGIICDRFGRKVGTVAGVGGMLLSMLATSFCRTVELFIVARFFVAAFTMGAMVAIFCHVMEIVRPNRRTIVGMSYQVTYPIGYMLWSAIGYVWRDWHDMQLASFIISAPLFIIVLIVPESPRWLFTTGKDAKGKQVTATMAKFNRTKLNDTVWNEAEKSATEVKEKESASTLDLFRYRGLRILTLKVCFSWAVNSMVYYGISLNAGSLAGNIYINNVLAGLFEIMAYVVCALTMDRIGRRLLLTVTLTGAGVGLLASTLVNEFAEGSNTLITVGVVFAFISKALISASFAVIYNFTIELFPTVLRTNGMGVGSVSARIAGALSPFIIEIQDYVSWLPNTIFGVLAIIGGLLSLTFRDTTGRPMMETIEDAELFHASGKDLLHVKNEKAYGHENSAFEVDDSEVSTQL